MHSQSNYSTKSLDGQMGEGIRSPLSIQAKLELRALGLSHFAYLLDVIYLHCDERLEDVTAKEIALIAGWNDKSVSRVLLASTEFRTEILHVLDIDFNSCKKSVQNSKGRKAQRFTLPEPKDLDTYFGVQEPEHLYGVRTETYLTYKEDVTQYPMITTKPGELSSFELANRAHVSRPTLIAHRKNAGTISFQRKDIKTAKRDEIPATYGDFMDLTQRFRQKHEEGGEVKPAKLGNRLILPSLRLVYQGQNYGYSQRNYDMLIDQGADPDQIKAMYFKNSKHFVRIGLRVKGAKYTSKYHIPFVERSKKYYIPAQPEPMEITMENMPRLECTVSDKLPPTYPTKADPNAPSWLQKTLAARYGTELANKFMEVTQ